MSSWSPVFSLPSADLQWAWWKWHMLLMHPSVQKQDHYYSGLETEIHFSCFYWARSRPYAPSLSMGWLGNAVLRERQPPSSLAITALYYSTCVTGLMYSQGKSIWEGERHREKESLNSCFKPLYKPLDSYIYFITINDL